MSRVKDDREVGAVLVNQTCKLLTNEVVGSEVFEGVEDDRLDDQGENDTAGNVFQFFASAARAVADSKPTTRRIAIVDWNSNCVKLCDVKTPAASTCS